MPYNDGIHRKYCFSLTDFHEFDQCPFRFFVKHHLEKKYEVEEGNFNLALGSVLDQAIKIFHQVKAYDQPPDYLPNLVTAAVRRIQEAASRQKLPSFYSAVVPFINQDLITKARDIFQNYYLTRKGKISPVLINLDFCEYLIETKAGRCKLWGGPDTIEVGEDGIPEIVDYKYKESDEGKRFVEMELMPKVYTLLVSQELLAKGYDRARFMVRFWHDPLDESLQIEFNLTDLTNCVLPVQAKIEQILSTTQITFCEKSYCKVCTHPDREKFIKLLLEKHGLVAAKPNPAVTSVAGQSDSLSLK